ncbi:hypothetical protein MTO96_013404 [Rhipicephalus appendiculatus]
MWGKRRFRARIDLHVAMVLSTTPPPMLPRRPPSRRSVAAWGGTVSSRRRLFQPRRGGHLSRLTGMLLLVETRLFSSVSKSSSLLDS